MMPIKLTKAVRIILFACIGMFVLQKAWGKLAEPGEFEHWLGLVPMLAVMKGRIWQLVTYSFLHADVLHLVFNMLMLVFIGVDLEQLWGTWRFVRFYFFCVILAGFSFLFMQLFWPASTEMLMVGASGGIYGLLVAYGVLFGERVLLFMMLFPMKAKHFTWILMGVEFFTGLFSERSPASSVAHLTGMVAGFGYLWFTAYWLIYRRKKAEAPAKNIPLQQRPASTKKGHLKLVVDKDKKGFGDNDNEPPRTWH